MSQPTTTENLAPTQYVVPVQALQGLPKLAKATTSPAPSETAAATPQNWMGMMFCAAIWTAAVAMGFDLLYGGADVRAMQTKAQQVKQQATELQQQNHQLQQGYQHQAQAINTAQAALGCPTGGSAQ